MKVRVYVGCALTSAPRAFRENVEWVKKQLRAQPTIELLEFLGLEKGTARDVYNHDIVDCVGTCDIMVAICDYPSTGLGFEMATQIGRRKPLLAFATHDAKVTRLILDMPVADYRFERFNDFMEIFNATMEAVVDHLVASSKEKPVSA